VKTNIFEPRGSFRGVAEAEPAPAKRAPGFFPAPLPPNESERLQALRGLNILDTDAEQAFDDLTGLAATLCATPMALLSLIDDDRQWFKSRVGIAEQSTPREWSFCAHTILQPDQTMEVRNALEDSRFAGNPLVQDGPEMRFYAGAPVLAADGSAIGALAVLDRRPRTLSDDQQLALRSLARQVAAQLELREAVAELEGRSLIDPLTRVGTRRAFDLKFREEWNRHRRSDERLALLMIALDPGANRSRQESDQTLSRVARLLGKRLCANDYLARYSAERFAILLPESTIQEATVAAEGVRLSIAHADWGASPETVCIGVDVARPLHNLDERLLLARADRALYHARRSGRNRVAVFEGWHSPVAA
jgi:diguanylate cyclase (GGDEF)-like protein